MLDEAVKNVCSNFKSAFENLKQGNIKHFCLRYITKNKGTYIAKIENQYFSKKYNTICPSILGKELKTFDNYNLRKITNMKPPGSENKKQGGITCLLHYNKKLKIFRLYIPEYIEKTKVKKNNYVSIDPGIRTFLTCYGKDRAFQIGNNFSKIIGKYIDKLKKARIEEKSKNKKYRKLEIRINNKIKNKVNELHWKSINILIKNYDTIIIGKWSTKDICARKTSVLASKTKILAQRTNYYKFLNKLQYKCNLKNINLKIVEESYTSRVCSNCGYDKRNLKGSKIFNCDKCKKKINRDINGAKNILLKAL
jgi:putative transposase